MYSRCLEISDDFDDDVTIRLCSLWFSNFDDVSLHEKVRDALDRVPSRKFVFLAHQISARLSKSVTAETPKHQENLRKLVVRMCEEHPFHSLYQVYCLLPERPASSPTIRRQASRHDVSTSQSERGAAASDIFDRLRGDPLRGERVRDLERTCDAFVEWAQHPIKENPHYQNRRGKTLKIPEELQIRKVQKVQVPVVSVDTPLDYTLRYDNCVWIERYEDTFEPAGGVNVPKISICHGSDGEKYKQLVSVPIVNTRLTSQTGHVSLKGRVGTTCDRTL
jgi:ataxia telangiectasia mutated family protein